MTQRMLFCIMSCLLKVQIMACLQHMSLYCTVNVSVWIACNLIQALLANIQSIKCYSSKYWFKKLWVSNFLPGRAGICSSVLVYPHTTGVLGGAFDGRYKLCSYAKKWQVYLDIHLSGTWCLWKAVRTTDLGLKPFRNHQDRNHLFPLEKRNLLDSENRMCGWLVWRISVFFFFFRWYWYLCELVEVGSMYGLGRHTSLYITPYRVAGWPLSQVADQFKFVI